MRLLASLLLALTISAAVPTPKEHLGHEAGADNKIADFNAIRGYFEKLAQSSDRIKLEEFGKSANGRPMLVAYISSPENLRQLDRLKQINRRLALGQATPEEAKVLAREGKAIVWIDSGLHASEIAPAQHAPELAYRMLTDESEEVRKIRDNVILLQIPVINPDGLDTVAHWFAGNVGTEYERAGSPYLYQKYAGHDNNRDWFMMNLVETRAVSKLLFQDWFPQIVYNQHQSAPFPARIFIPPYAEPLNPNIPGPVMEGINLIGSAMKERLSREGKTGAISYHGFDAWWNGGLRSVPAFHNMHGILTETASNNWAAPRTYSLKDLPERFPNGIPTKDATVFYERPWLGGTWTFRDQVEYMLTCDFAILELAASRSVHFLTKSYDLARANIDAGTKQTPYAYVVPTGQWDPTSAAGMLERLRLGGIEVRRAKAEFTAGSKTYPAGTHVMLAGQPFRGYLVDLMEPQKYPELKSGTTGPTKRPYDVAGWTLSYQMGVKVDRIEDQFSADLDLLLQVNAPTPSLDHRDNGSFLATADLLKQKQPVRWASDGKILRPADEGYGNAAYELRAPRVGLYQPHPENIDAGWTEWTLDEFHIPHTVLHNDDFKRGDLRQRFDTIIFAQQRADSILHGIKQGEATSRRAGTGELPTQQRPEFTGGIALRGLANLEDFVRAGGTLIALDSATELPLQFLPIAARGLLRATEIGDETASGYYSPGSILRIDVDNTNPIAFGMPREAYAMSTGGQAFEITLLPEFNHGDRAIRSFAKYAEKNLLASGWISGEKAVTGKSIAIESRMGAGRVVMFGFRPQFRAQSHGTFKMLLNAIYLGSAKTL